MNSETVRKAIASIAAAVLGLLAALTVASPASAHVSVDSGSSPGKGGYGVVRLLAPTESTTASTVGITLTIPEDVTLSSARTLVLPGWSGSVESADGRVTRIVWQVEDAATAIAPGEFGVFTFSAGRWPEDRDSVALPIVQHYSDGSEVAWDEIALDESSEPEHPAPVVNLGAADGSSDGHGADGSTVAADASSATGGGEIVQWVLVGIAVVLSALAVLVAFASRRRQQSP